VADGVGGNFGGATASMLAVNSFMEVMRSESKVSFEDAFSRIVNLFVKAVQEDSSLSEMATTLSCIKIDGEIAQFAHVGDSRIYHLRGNGILQITSDQTEAALLMDKGILSPSRARKYHRRSVLVSALSSTGDYTFTTGQFQLAVGDRVLLLTDGVYRLISKKALRDESVSCNSAFDYSLAIESALHQMDLIDDATMVTIQIDV
jgi:protein phosphatase